ncbi:metallophosphoesterase family protein [Dongia rigui]|uniref:Metallophosphoesterase n=1 Tax=Dongia rigui TaxID=940149 RepID=A0ABU5E436_9PROT|nr:metallophosphoesterase [Dongia rigui]MDY0874296.1 metallophosphoesterase [Dongia rigui]
MTAYTLAHFSDPHLGPLPAAGWRELANKRLSGFFSWTRNRVDIHKPEVLRLLVEDLKRHAPDHIAITGDLVNISLPAEFRAAARWLQSVGTADKVTVIPGNHDAYIDMPWSESLAQWAPYMAGERDGVDHASEPQSSSDFPFVRHLGEIALIGTSTAVPMPPFIAAGRLGSAQLDRLRRQLLALGQRGLFRVVLIHHPPFGGGAYKRKSLLDAKDFQAVIAEAGAELVLHGHTHVSGLGRIHTAKGPIPVIGVPSASAVAAGHKDASRYHLYRVSRQADSWRLDVDIRGLNAAQNAFAAQGSMSMAIPLLVSPNVPVAGAAA